MENLFFRLEAERIENCSFIFEFFSTDIIISKDGAIYPTEFKKSATLDRKDARHFDELAIFKQPVATGAVVSIYPQKTHLREDVLNLPASSL
ncbi:MAG: hypothetical protein J6S19_02385 [Lentisphaeria bacterium]|nr:hypothetical protein [Lentisphaeria bacterium]